MFGHFDGESQASEHFAINNNFSVSSVTGDTSVGALIGYYYKKGQEVTFTNNWFDPASTSVNMCDSDDIISCQTNDAANFINSMTTDPLNVWDFSTIWVKNTDIYPTLAPYAAQPVKKTINNAVDGQTVEVELPTGTKFDCSDVYNEVHFGAKFGDEDTECQYPVGFVEFCIKNAKASNQVSVIFVTDLKASDVTLRKADINNKIYFTVDGATLVKTTYNGKHAIKATYTIADNGEFDMNSEDDYVQDPVGLGVVPSTQNSGITTVDGGLPLASTGSPLMNYVVAASAVILGGVASLVALKKRTRSLER